MPCPFPGRETKAASLKAEADFKAEQLAKKKAEAVRLHVVVKEPHAVIMRRLKVTRPTLVSWLREAEMDGYSARPVPEKNVHGAAQFSRALDEREAFFSASEVPTRAVHESPSLAYVGYFPPSARE